ncbi:type II toxin-antitoxin system RelE/ParE family toxin [Echinicola rosea]|uniref:Type II toxin-antitoxin system RelE/ParE family toxin n=1 Tax=Echinicola rosea TaxID=1807691 RepID=A0ABQ1V212_9BACT|nr:hypothetical protein GCM10011339_21370 [Echinicola rosea]
MNRKVVLSRKAKNNLTDLLEFLERRWSVKVKSDFIKKLDYRIKLILTYPKSCPESKEIKGLYRCVVTKQTSFLYKIKPNFIEIVVIYDNRQHPKRITGKRK